MSLACLGSSVGGPIGDQAKMHSPCLADEAELCQPGYLSCAVRRTFTLSHIHIHHSRTVRRLVSYTSASSAMI